MTDSFVISRWPCILQCGTQIITMACASSQPIAFSFFWKWENNVWRITRKSWCDLPYWMSWWSYLSFKSCHISRVKVTEYELILARAGNFHPSHDEITVAKLAVCPKHRHNLGTYWRPLRIGNIYNKGDERQHFTFKTPSTGRWPRRAKERRASARNVSFRISLRWLIHIINSVDKTKLSFNTPTDAAPQFL